MPINDQAKLRLLQAAARLRAESERLRKAAESWRTLDILRDELPPEVVRQFEEQDAEIFEGTTPEQALAKAEKHWRELAYQALLIEQKAHSLPSVSDKPRDRFTVPWVSGVFAFMLLILLMSYCSES